MKSPVFWAQLANVAAMLLLAAAAAAAARAPGLFPRYRLSWRLFAAVTLAGGVSYAVQNAFGAAALAAGAGTPVWDAYVAWAPGMNYGRTLLWYAFAALLLVHGHSGEGARMLRPAGVWAALGAAYAAGQAAGFVEGPYTPVHEARFALLCHGEVVLMTAGLVLTVARDRVDRLMALAVAVNIAVLPMASSWMWWRSKAGADTPSAVYLQVYYLVFWLASTAIVMRRAWLARRGVPVPGLLASLSALRAHGMPEKGPTGPR